MNRAASSIDCRKTPNGILCDDGFVVDAGAADGAFVVIDERGVLSAVFAAADVDAGGAAAGVACDSTAADAIASFINMPCISLTLSRLKSVPTRLLDENCIGCDAAAAAAAAVDEMPRAVTGWWGGALVDSTKVDAGRSMPWRTLRNSFWSIVSSPMVAVVVVVDACVCACAICALVVLVPPVMFVRPPAAWPAAAADADADVLGGAGRVRSELPSRHESGAPINSSKADEICSSNKSGRCNTSVDWSKKIARVVGVLIAPPTIDGVCNTNPFCVWPYAAAAAAADVTTVGVDAAECDWPGKQSSAWAVRKLNRPKESEKHMHTDTIDQEYVLLTCIIEMLRLPRVCVCACSVVLTILPCMRLDLRVEGGGRESTHPKERKGGRNDNSSDGCGIGEREGRIDIRVGCCIPTPFGSPPRSAAWAVSRVCVFFFFPNLYVFIDVRRFGAIRVRHRRRMRNERKR